MADYHISNISNNIKIHNPQGGFTISSEDESLSCSSEDVEDLSAKIFNTGNTIGENNLSECKIRELSKKRNKKIRIGTALH